MSWLESFEVVLPQDLINRTMDPLMSTTLETLDKLLHQAGFSLVAMAVVEDTWRPVTPSSSGSSPSSGTS